jgi:glycogen operon protein
VTPAGVYFAVVSRDAAQVTLCLFDGETETRFPMQRKGDLHHLLVPGARPGQAYGYRASGPWSPENGLLFDDSKLLADPYAMAVDKEFVFDPRLAERGCRYRRAGSQKHCLQSAFCRRRALPVSCRRPDL